MVELLNTSTKCLAFRVRKIIPFKDKELQNTTKYTRLQAIILKGSGQMEKVLPPNVSMKDSIPYIETDVKAGLHLSLYSLWSLSHATAVIDGNRLMGTRV